MNHSIRGGGTDCAKTVCVTVPKMDSPSTNMLHVLTLTKQACANPMREQVARLVGLPAVEAQMFEQKHAEDTEEELSP